MDAALANEIMVELCARIEVHAVPHRLEALRANQWSIGAAKLFQNNCPNIPGFKYLGSGHFSIAFECEAHPGYAFKVGFKKQDSGAAFAAYCRDRKGTPHLPVVLHLAQMSGFYLVCMPKYNKNDNIKWSRWDNVYGTVYK